MFEIPGAENRKAMEMAAAFLRQATAADNSGDERLAMHLYLAAFEKSINASDTPSEDAINGLKKAWQYAYKYKERSLAEYIFEKTQPYLTNDEIHECSLQLQDLSLDKLAEYGFDKEQLRGVADMIQHEIDEGGTLLHMDTFPGSFSFDGHLPGSSVIGGTATIRIPRESGSDTSDNSLVNSSVSEGVHSSANSAKKQLMSGNTPDQLAAVGATAKLDTEIALPVHNPTYQDIHGYAKAIREARTLGVGKEKDPAYTELMDQLNSYHGLAAAPAPDALVFIADAREDAIEFMHATVAELGLTGITMHIEDNFQGASMLCVTADKASSLKYNSRTGLFSGKGVLLLEDLDLWDIPPVEPEEGINGFLMAQLSRGAREAINMIHAAVMDPNIYVMASASKEAPIEKFFMDLLEPLKQITIELPTPGERADVWLDIAHKHPSLRLVDRAQLVRFSANMPRYDIYCAAREAVEEAYKNSLASEHFEPVSPSVLFEKLAAYQPLESDEYKALEDAIISDFWATTGSLEDILGK